MRVGVGLICLLAVDQLLFLFSHSWPCLVPWSLMNFKIVFKIESSIQSYKWLDYVTVALYLILRRFLKLQYKNRRKLNLFWSIFKYFKFIWWTYIVLFNSPPHMLSITNLHLISIDMPFYFKNSFPTWSLFGCYPTILIIFKNWILSFFHPQ